LITELESIQHHLKREYEKDLKVDCLGYTYHVECLEHCLPYAFGQCTNSHISNCDQCNKISKWFHQLMQIMPNDLERIINNRNKLQYYWSHQARKTYLNAQFNANLLSIDEEGAIIVVDYKMKILPKSAREAKSDFYGKSGWTLHSMLVYTKHNNDLEIQAFDHWSSDTAQDAWFTASCFEVVFNTLEKKPKWIKILSDNGAHYHCSELMAMIAN